MFERIKNFFRTGGAKIGMVETLNSIVDHPKIAVTEKEYLRIIENKKIFAGDFPDVSYLNSENEWTTRSYRSLNTPKIISRKLSKLVFNDGCTISLDDPKSDAFLQDVFQKSKFTKNFGEELEAGYAIGGLALRPYVDSNSNEIRIAFCRADTFFPLQSSTNDISEAAIANVSVVTEGTKNVYYTLLEFHEWENGTYYIRNELYRSEEQGVLGYKVSLKSLEKYKMLENEVAMTGFSRPLFVYIKLAGKNNKDLSSPLSLGVIDNAKRQFNDINDKYDQFMWEIEEAGRKIIASDHFFKYRYNQHGEPIRNFDRKTAVFQRLKADDPFIDEFSPSLRSSEFIESINFILRIIELQSGFSSGTFSFDGSSVKTATEIISENSETFSTRSDNVLIVEEALKELITSIFELAEAYQLYSHNGDLGINIDFDDGVFQGQEQKADYYAKLITGQLTSRKRAIEKLFGVTEKEALKIVREIQDEVLGLDPQENEQQAANKELGDEE